MKILFFSGWFPYPPDNGSRIRLYNFIKALAQKHDVFLISLLQTDSNPLDAEKLADICQVVSLHESHWFNPKSLKSYIGYFSSRPRSIIETYDPTIEIALRKAIKQVNPDVIVVSTLPAAEYALDILNIPSVLIDHNCEFTLLKRNADFAKNKLQKLRLDMGWKKSARWEAKICQRFSVVVMPTEDDKQQMLDFAPFLQNIHVISNAADTDYYDPTCWKPEKNRLIYNGALTYSANLDAVEYYISEIYPLVSTELPKTKLMVTGRNDGVDLGLIISRQGVELTGYVDDIREELYKSAACIIPLRKGAGMRLKIPEAMAAGVPVVSTSMGAEGLDCVHNEHLLIADTSEEFAEAIVRILTDKILVERLRKNARELIEQRYSWKISAQRFVSLVEAVVS